MKEMIVTAVIAIGGFIIGREIGHRHAIAPFEGAEQQVFGLSKREKEEKRQAEEQKLAIESAKREERRIAMEKIMEEEGIYDMPLSEVTKLLREQYGADPMHWSNMSDDAIKRQLGYRILEYGKDHHAKPVSLF